MSRKMIVIVLLCVLLAMLLSACNPFCFFSKSGDGYIIDQGCNNPRSSSMTINVTPFELGAMHGTPNVQWGS